MFNLVNLNMICVLMLFWVVVVGVLVVCARKGCAGNRITQLAVFHAVCVRVHTCCRVMVRDKSSMLCACVCIRVAGLNPDAMGNCITSPSHWRVRGGRKR